MQDGTLKSLGHIGGAVPLTGVAGRSQSCEIRDLLDRLGDKWSLLVIELLGSHGRRFSELRREIDGISQRMLTRTLRQLERDGLVNRTVHPVVPPRVDYELTPLGMTLLEIVEPLVKWTRAHRHEISAARDAREPDVTASGLSIPR
jgi:DNA-binding HxlR family transcriptional regulator